ncbi:MAG: redoxin domain-containing protein [Chloroflexi bacterium]|nr:redoxin domain-containing protein [Chloroflexota bacterium]
MDNAKLEEKGALVLGLSVDSAPVQRAFAASFGGCPYPLLADFHPKGEVARKYGVYDEERGVSKRAVFIVDKEGVVRWKRLYPRGLPETSEVLAALEEL